MSEDELLVDVSDGIDGQSAKQARGVVAEPIRGPRMRRLVNRKGSDHHHELHQEQYWIDVEQAGLSVPQRLRLRADVAERFRGRRELLHVNWFVGRVFRRRAHAALGTIGALSRGDYLTGGCHDTRIHPHSRSH